MGGCRCTYRNCTVKTDGKTHMFHYPVFEKVRCHQWLVNAQKLEFLNLKVSQLKNRVVCQHHFKEDNFMNYMNDKLTFGAIPTEDGPYCDSSQLNNYDLEEKPYSNLILLEDIESDYLFGNKQAIFSLKYGDFLTNGEFVDSRTRYNSNNVENIDSANYNNCFLKATPIKPQPARLGLAPQDCINEDQIIIIQNPSDHKKFDENISKTLKKVHVTKSQSIYQEQSPIKLELNTPQIIQSQQEKRVKIEPKVKILSETKINWPLPITGKFEKISPGTTLLIPEKKYEPITKVSNNTSKVLNKKAEDFKVLEVLDVEFLPKQETVEAVGKNVILPSPKIAHIVKPQSSRMINKSKLTAERTAEIEKKRQFNMKLKNVIESCLNKIDVSPKIDDKPNKKNSQKSILKDANVQDITNPVNEESMKKVEDRTIAFMEARMNKMEQTLLSRIDRNSQNIIELKNSFHKARSKDKKLVNAQTNTSGECYKTFLFQEISPFLSENAKNLIYEDLFIDRYSVTPTTNSYNRKRRKICV